MKFLTALFFLSGFAALLYQVIWQRILTLFSGVDAQSVSITVAAYMLGMGTGSMCGALLSEKISRKQAIIVFAFAELCIAGFALSSKFILYDTLYMQFSALAKSQATLAIVAFLILLIPTFCMGITLPLLSKAVTFKRNEASSAIGVLYGINTLGAAVGALGAVLLIRYLGMGDSVFVGAAINFSCAAGATVLFLRKISGESAPSEETTVSEESVASEQSEVSTAQTQLPLLFWIISYFVSGYVSLSLELIWFRVLGVVLKPNSFTFAWLLFLFLTGIAIGSFIGINLARKLKNPVAGFFLTQALTPLFSGLSLPVCLYLLEHVPLFERAWSYMGAGSPMMFSSHITAEFVQLYVVAASFLIVPPTILMGIGFPLLQRAVQTDVQHVGLKVGFLQTANIIGAVLGSLLVGLVFFSTLGISNSLRSVVACAAWPLLFWCKFQFRSRSKPQITAAYIGTAAIFLAVIFSIPSSEKLLASMHGTQPDNLIVREDRSGTAALMPFEKKDFAQSVMVLANGQGQSQFPYGKQPVHTDIGLLASLVHPHPLDVGVIGLGSGETAYAASGSPETQSVDCIEVIGPEIETLRELQKRRNDSALDALASDKRVHFHFTDGRRFVQQGSKKFDVLEADALLPFCAYAGNLYSEEFFRLLANQLKPGGIAISWFPTQRTKKSFLNVFPYVDEFEGIGVGSNQPISATDVELLARAADPQVAAHFKKANCDSHASLKRLLTDRKVLQTALPAKKYADVNSDLFPRDEFRTPESTIPGT
ncbi:MAG: spermidine synthase [Cyanobacteria bacterium SZAS-4]|nr:spermidine synthase [Cyanobacteria bacterium SZAS-4]